VNSVVDFDKAAHRYSLSGRSIPSVTQILGSYTDLSRVSPDVLKRAQEFGTAVHTMTELHDLNRLDESSLDPALRPYLDAWIQFRGITGFCPLVVEERLYCKKHGFEIAGTLDRVGDLRGELVLIDIKSGSSVFPTTALQTAAYAEAYRSTTGSRIRRRFACRLDAGSFELIEFKDRSDWSTFLSMLQIHNWRMKNGC
jgi:ATP-dependent exoDNAse (exonuclease V) beta subunit